jgi:hypothetical protein
MLRLTATIILLCVSIIAGLMTLITSSGSYDHTITNSRKMLAQFELASSNGVAAATDQPYMISLAPIDVANCDDKEFQAKRKAAGDKELLTAWRGEWTECFSPTSRTSSLIFDKNKYSLLGRVALDTAVFGSLCASSLFAALILFKSYFRRRKTGPSKPQPTP